MAYEEITALLGGWPGFELVGVEREAARAAGEGPRIMLTLRAVPGQAKTCSRCGAAVSLAPSASYDTRYLRKLSEKKRSRSSCERRRRRDGIVRSASSRKPTVTAAE
jgi:hypothetical protein